MTQKISLQFVETDITAVFAHGAQRSCSRHSGADMPQISLQIVTPHIS
jgi:hypothetical protein